jgi:hypothetical protein
MIREQEVSRLPNVHPTQHVANSVTQLTTNMATQLSASNELTIIIQLPVTPIDVPPNDPEGEDESGREGAGPGEEIHTSWLIPNHKQNYVPDEFICRWTPCDVVFNTYGELIRHIRAHQLAFQCKWGECNDIVPVTKALRHMTRDKHKAHRDGICRWNNCSQKYRDRTQLNSHMSHCMNLQRSVFECPWKDCHKNIKRSGGIKRHLVEFHWKLRKEKRVLD